MFQSAKKLENLFNTEAAFYKLQTHGKIHLCRSLAAVRRKGTEIEEEPDALFVLLNPGRCLPVDGEETISMLTGEVEVLPMLQATPDNTMYQLMRLMERMGWNHIEIINLTDVLTGKFGDYLECQEWMKLHHDNRHSIFSIDRYPELLERVEKAGVVIAGWGTKSKIASAAEEANTILWEIAEVKGLRYNQHPLYYHPFPWLQTRCVMWLDDMEEQLKRVGEVV
ncbi:DUF1643 domain-containing protein [Planomicrobium okeanokoites]|uniref:DUF1643 domain-containing protein n=1 Tax=Planomicrobium okeanokoites TaxID=244 RepID=UPI00248FAB9A|nr:hypothetical protein [Planomicrobium okeanokoites]